MRYILEKILQPFVTEASDTFRSFSTLKSLPEFLFVSIQSKKLNLPPSSAQKESSSFPSDINGVIAGARRLEASLESPVLFPPHQTTEDVEEKRMKTPLESRLLALNGRSTALEVYGVEPSTLTRYFLGAVGNEKYKYDFFSYCR